MESPRAPISRPDLPYPEVEPCPPLVYHAHQLNLLGGNRFLLFDNGRMNTFSSAVIIRVDEVKEEAHLEFRCAFYCWVPLPWFLVAISGLFL